MTVRDLILGGEPLRVEEKRGSQAAAPWDRLAARIVTVHGKNRFTGAILRFRHELSQQLLEVFEKMAAEMQGAIRAEADEGHEAAPVPRAVAREVMVRTPLFPRILSQLWMFDAVGAGPCARAGAEKHRRRGGAVLRGALPTHPRRVAGGRGASPHISRRPGFLRSDVMVHFAPAILGQGLGEDGLGGHFGAVETVAGERCGAVGA